MLTDLRIKNTITIYKFTETNPNYKLKIQQFNHKKEKKKNEKHIV